MQFDVIAACPQGFMPADEDVALGQGRARVVGTAKEAVEGADMVVTDTWISMGQDHADTKLAAMMPFQVDAALMATAKPDAQVPALPARAPRRGSDPRRDRRAAVADLAGSRKPAARAKGDPALVLRPDRLMPGGRGPIWLP